MSNIKRLIHKNSSPVRCLKPHRIRTAPQGGSIVSPLHRYTKEYATLLAIVLFCCIAGTGCSSLFEKHHAKACGNTHHTEKQSLGAKYSGTVKCGANMLQNADFSVHTLLTQKTGSMQDNKSTRAKKLSAGGTPETGHGNRENGNILYWKTGTFGTYTLPHLIQASPLNSTPPAHAHSAHTTAVNTPPHGGIGLTAPDNNTRGWIEQFVPVTGGKHYRISVRIQADKVTYARAGVQILAFTANSTRPLSTDIRETLKIKIKTPTHGSHTYTADYTPPKDVERILFRLYLGTHAAVERGAAVFFDSVLFAEKTCENMEGEKSILSGNDATFAACSNTREAQIANNPFRKNLITNAEFEQSEPSASTLWENGLSPQGWAAWVPQKGAGLQLALDSAQSHGGGRAIRITSDGQSRLCLHSTYAVESSKMYRLSLYVKTNRLMGKGVYVRVQYSKDGKKFAVPKDFSGTIPAIGTHSWKEQAALFTIPDGVTHIKTELFYDSAVGTAWLDSFSLKESYPFTLNYSQLKKRAGKTVRLNAVVPKGVDGSTVQWTSSAPQYAEVDAHGTVQLLKAGKAIITARTEDGNTASCTISIEQRQLKSEYGEIRKRWKNRMTLHGGKNREDPDYQEVTERLTMSANLRWENMIRSKDREDLWGKYGSGYLSEHLTQTLIDLRYLAQAFCAEDSPLYRNTSLKKDILSALQWFYTRRYNEHVRAADLYGNWWDWCIGVPQKLCDILVLMYDYIGTKDMNRYLAAIRHFSKQPDIVLKGPNPLTGANLLDCATVAALSGALEENNARLLDARDAVSAVLPYVTRGDGFYQDGSFIQHTVFPYTGSYGAVTLAGIENLLYIFYKTPWQVHDSRIRNVFDWVHTAFEPLFYKSAIMDMVSGRSIARKNASDHSRGKALLARILALADMTDNPYERLRIRSFVKGEVLADKLYRTDEVYRESYFTTMNPNDALAFKQLLSDDGVKERGTLQLNHVYAGMDRVVHRGNGWCAGVSMHSTRTGAFEVGNGENKRGWHTADGFLQLYNDDQLHYADNYWATVDHHRLCGTTTDSTDRTNKNWALNTSKRDWAGGVSLYGRYGTAGMEYEAEKLKSSLTAKKSWFFFDNEIVCLGAGITASDNRFVETIAENRKLRNAGDTFFAADGKEVLPSFGTVTLHNPSWAFLGANIETGTGSVGYYFPQKTTITVSRELRSGTWNAVNDHLSEETILRNFLSIAIPHGVNPREQSYAYVLLPCLTQAQTASYSGNPDMRILANTAAVQAVQELRHGITGCNFFIHTSILLPKDSSSSGGVYKITAAQPCAVMLREIGESADIAVSDPTWLQPIVRLTVFGGQFVPAERLPDYIQAEATNDGNLHISIDTKKAYGKTFTVRLKKRSRMSRIPPFIKKEEQ